MSTPGVEFDNTFVRDLPGLFEPWQAAPAPAPALLALNDALAAELGLDAEHLRTPEGVAILAGNTTPPGASPVAQAYAGHQFGGYSPRLGDGRALLVGDFLDRQGRRRDLHLKGSGRTPYARGGDGKAAVGPMLREYVISEAMHALGIPTTRSLAVVATGETIVRDTFLPGAVLARIAASHVRVGTFQYAAATGGPELVGRLVDHTVTRHHPAAAGNPNAALGLLDAVVEAQAALVARWMAVGFIHGVMNTDNVTISGETIDYGPCAFMDTYDPATVFSSIDTGGRYAYGNQPPIMYWNLARLAESLLPLVDADSDTAVAEATLVLQRFPERHGRAWSAAMRAKLGLVTARPDDDALANDLLSLMQRHGVDFTSAFRALGPAARGDDRRLAQLFVDGGELGAWLGRWRERLADEGRDPGAVAADLDAVNPVYIPRNHLVEEALAAATAGDLGPFDELVDVVRRPFTERPGLERYARPAPAGAGPYRTFCGT